MKTKLILFLLLLPFALAYSQTNATAKFGNISVSDFSQKVYSVDSNAHAVIIADIGSSNIEGNNKGWFSLTYKHYRRVHILNKNAYDLANISVPLYTNGSAEEELGKVKAVTYNLENGKVIETKLDTKTGIFKDVLRKNFVVKKFTMPNVKEGSIIEYEYTVQSDFLHNLQPWIFQGDYPRLWSEYNLRLPGFFSYTFLMQGYLPYHLTDKKTGNTIYRVSFAQGAGATENAALSANYTDYRWVIKDAPAMKEEPFISTTKNYIAKIEFQLSEHLHPLPYKSFIPSWGAFANEFMKMEHFGVPLTKDNRWLNEILDPIVDNVSDELEKARRIYAWVQRNISCVGHTGVLLTQDIKNIVKSRSGSVADINLLLIAMLRRASIVAHPVLLSTRERGFIHPLYPFYDRFNYVVCLVEVNGHKYSLDASEPEMGFGLLPIYCYNGAARVIDNKASVHYFDSNSQVESSITSVTIFSENGKLIGRKQELCGKQESFSLRKKIKNKGLQDYFDEIKKKTELITEMSNEHTDSLNKNEEILGIGYDFKLREMKEDVIYFNPMFGEGVSVNPFKSEERFYPVEMPHTIDQTYSFQMPIPDGYEVDEMPRQMLLKLNEANEGFLEYRIINSGSGISLRSRLVLKRSVFNPDEYEMLREFYNLVVKKHNEPIVFKKKS